MDYSWLTTEIIMVLISAIYIAVIFFTRLSGLRSFSKMSSFDFAMTVAGTVISSAKLATKRYLTFKLDTWM